MREVFFSRAPNFQESSRDTWWRAGESAVMYCPDCGELMTLHPDHRVEPSPIAVHRGVGFVEPTYMACPVNCGFIARVALRDYFDAALTPPRAPEHEERPPQPVGGEWAAVEAAARAVCPDSHETIGERPGDVGLYICIGESGTPIIEADTVAEVITQMSDCWAATQGRLDAERDRSAAAVRALTDVSMFVRKQRYKGALSMEAADTLLRFCDEGGAPEASGLRALTPPRAPDAATEAGP